VSHWYIVVRLVGLSIEYLQEQGQPLMDRGVFTYDGSLLFDLTLFRLILAVTNHLHEEISILRDRIRHLEGALGSIHHRRTGQTHPLLASLPEDNWDNEDWTKPDAVSHLDTPKVSEDHDILAEVKDGSARLFGSVSGAFVNVMSV
jgi:hypothetical protein